MTIEERAKKRIITILSSHREPVKVRSVQAAMGGNISGNGIFRNVLIELVEDGTVWHEGGFLKLNGDVPIPGRAYRSDREIPESKSIGIEQKS